MNGYFILHPLALILFGKIFRNVVAFLMVNPENLTINLENLTVTGPFCNGSSV